MTTKAATKPAPAPRKRAAKKPATAPIAVVAGRIEVGGVLEPDWDVLLTNEAERPVASSHWRRVAEEMHEREILSSSNGHAVQRLVLAYLVYDRCSTEVASGGIVDEPDNDKNPKAIARLSIHYKAMREAENTAERLEAQLGLSPGRRGKVAKVTAKRVRKAGADNFLGTPG
jgi:P27 family predicted phage terminase small subunit